MLPQFNYTLGTVTGIEIGFANLNFAESVQIVGDASASGSVKYTNAQLTDTISLFTVGSTSVSTEFVAGPASGSQQVSAGVFHLTPPLLTSQSTSGNGVVPASFLPIFLTQSCQCSNLALVLGSPVTSGDVSSSGGVVAANLDPVIAPVTGDVDVTFTYMPAANPAAPEPSTIILMVLALPLFYSAKKLRARL